MFSAKKPEDPSIANNAMQLIIAFTSLTDAEVATRCQGYTLEQLKFTVMLLSPEQIALRTQAILSSFRKVVKSGASEDILVNSIADWANGVERKKINQISQMLTASIEESHLNHGTPKSEPTSAENETRNEQLLSTLEETARSYVHLQNAAAKISSLHATFANALENKQAEVNQQTKKSDNNCSIQ